MKFNETQNYLDQFIGLEVSEAFKADTAGILVRDPYGSKSGVSDSNRYGRHSPINVGNEGKFKFKVMLTVDRTSGYSYEETISVIRGYRIEKVLNLKELKRVSLIGDKNEKN